MIYILMQFANKLCLFLKHCFAVKWGNTAEGQLLLKLMLRVIPVKQMCEVELWRMLKQNSSSGCGVPFWRLCSTICLLYIFLFCLHSTKSHLCLVVCVSMALLCCSQCWSQLLCWWWIWLPTELMSFRESTRSLGSIYCHRNCFIPPTVHTVLSDLPAPTGQVVMKDENVRAIVLPAVLLLNNSAAVQNIFRKYIFSCIWIHFM